MGFEGNQSKQVVFHRSKNHKKMKRIKYTISTLFLLFALQTSIGQINRTLETKVVDILAQFPTEDLEHSDRLMQEMLDLDAKGIHEFCKRIIPLGTGDDTQARYAVHSLAVYAGNHKESSVEKALLTALDNAEGTEVKTFFIDRLAFCGSDVSIELLTKYLKDEELFKPALATLTAIGTSNAAQAIYSTTQSYNGNRKAACIAALGHLRYAPASEALVEVMSDSKSDSFLKQKTLMALAEIANPDSYDILSKAVQSEDYQLGNNRGIIAYIHYGNRLVDEGNLSLAQTIAESLLKNCTQDSQLNFRVAGINLLSASKGKNATKTFLKEAKHHDEAYRGSVLKAAGQNLTPSGVLKWVKQYKKIGDTGKIQLLEMLRQRQEPEVLDDCISKAILSDNESLRLAGVRALAFQDKEMALPLLFKTLQNTDTDATFAGIENTLLKIVGVEDAPLVAGELQNMYNQKGKSVLVNVLAKRNATDQFDVIAKMLDQADPGLQKAIYKALPSVSSEDDLTELMDILSSAEDIEDINYVQQAIVKVLDGTQQEKSSLVYNAFADFGDKSKLIPILPAIKGDKALSLIAEQLQSDKGEDKMAAIQALAVWDGNESLPYMFNAIIDSPKGIRDLAFGEYLKKVTTSDYPDDQKLLLIRKLMPHSNTIAEKKQVIQAAQSAKTFLSLVFVSDYLDDPNLGSDASNAIVNIALPTPGVNNGLRGDVVRKAVSKSMLNLSGPDSQYIKIDAKEFLDKMPKEEGFVSIFNGKDLTGWEGLVENPIKRQKMSKSALKKAREKANAQMLKDWYVKDGVIGFKGEGYNNICTIKDYGDFEMLVDWKITHGGDSGIYLRGTPQVQIWDTAQTKVGAEVGSGGLYNNQKNASKPLVVADNPINEWNTFRIKMVGERVTVHLNGKLVTDNVVLENYWDRERAIFAKEAIELQAHGEDLGFRNIYVREIRSGNELLSLEEQKEGFQSLFNGKDLDHWIGNKTDYLVENNELAVQPKRGGHGNLYTANEYSDFTFRFDFKLTPGANNGLGIHAPLEGDVAYVGKELQILDNTAPIYANLKPYQYHGSVYGIAASKKGFLNPVGEWNSQEVIVKGDHIKIILNDQVILDEDIKKASENGTADGQEHPGLQRNSGHMAFLGHGSALWFRNIRIKELK
ncbi:hypothetical protein DN53_13250 [Flagellimonas olearia]|uniref:3-keto-alpha-glucoside-1,2-lyase/3-keto-2-hydroxy-glucal hydratase domain-containing protein n=2 Tax=Flagellimonas olearia TaxID=552546 RepID=A0A444VLX4_9FLAO|nr:hypothetical protein DN53_13250 [Allomuricauda olearia]